MLSDFVCSAIRRDSENCHNRSCRAPNRPVSSAAPWTMADLLGAGTVRQRLMRFGLIITWPDGESAVTDPFYIVKGEVGWGAQAAGEHTIRRPEQFEPEQHQQARWNESTACAHRRRPPSPLLGRKVGAVRQRGEEGGSEERSRAVVTRSIHRPGPDPARTTLTRAFQRYDRFGGPARSQAAPGRCGLDLDRQAERQCWSRRHAAGDPHGHRNRRRRASVTGLPEAR